MKWLPALAAGVLWLWLAHFRSRAPGGALLCRTRREQLAVGAFVMVATAANALDYPARIELWLAASAAFFIVALALTVALLAAAARQPTPSAA